MKEQFEFIFKPSSKQKKALRKFLQGQDLLVNLPTGFPASSNPCRCTAAYSVIQPTVLASTISGNHDIQDQKELHTCSQSSPGISEKTKETKVI